MFGRARGWFCVLGCVGAATAACSSTSSKYSSMQTYCAALAAEECQINGACGVTKDACTSARETLCAQCAAAMPANRVYAPDNVQACIDLAHKYYAADHAPFTPTEMAALDDACGRVFAGTTAKNGQCASSFDCEGALICDKGRCGDKTVKANAGDGCANAGELCATGLYCTASDEICAAKKIEGATCGDSAPCLETLFCNVTCVPRYTSGHPCASDDQCDPSVPYCDVYNGNICDDGVRFSVSEKSLCAKFGGAP